MSIPALFFRLAPVLALLALATPSPGQSILRTHTGGSDQDRLGTAVGGGGDTNMDGTPDVVVGSPGHDPGASADQGQVQVFSGVDGTQIFSQVGGAAGDQFGASVSISGDVDNDGRADIAVGAPFADPGLGAEQGQVVVYSGATGAVIHTIDGATAGDRFGAAVTILGDLNADGRAEVAVGAPRFDPAAGAEAGRVTIHSGLDASVLFTVDGANAGDLLGSALAALGDTNDDGLDDLAIGIPSFDGTAGADSGRMAIVSGANVAELQALEGGQAGAELGTSVGGPADVDGDLRNDAVGGAPLFDGVAGVDSGQVVVLSGRDGSTLLTFEGTAADARLGTSVGGGGDADLDGYDDVVAGAPLFDGAAGADSGRTLVISGVDASMLYAVEGVAAGDQDGSAVAGLGDVGSDGRLDVVTGAPQVAGGGTARGSARVLTSDTSAGSEVGVNPTASQPRAVTKCDADGDGDLDVIIVHVGTLSILWNGDQAGSTPLANLSETPRTDVALSPGADGVSVAAGQWDADAPCEIAVGRSDGTVDLFESTGSGAGTVFALTAASPFTVDGAVSPGPVSGLAFLGSGASASIIAAGAGTLTIPGFLDQINGPAGAPTLTGAFVTGGSFAAVVVGDVTGDGNDDIVAANSGTGGSGGVHVLPGPGFTPATGSPYAAGTPPASITLLDLDGDTTRDDVAIASLSLATGGVRVLPDYVLNTGFSAANDPGLALARQVARGNLDASGQDDLAVLDGAGNLVRLEGWDGAAFTAQTTTPTTEGAGTALAVGQLTQGAPGLCDPDEITTVHLSSDLAATWRLRRVFDVRAVAMSGCPTTAPVSLVSISADPVIGQTTMTVDLTAAAPLSLAFLSAQENLPVGSTPSLTTTGNCGIASSTGTIIQLFTFTDVVGSATLAAGLPNDPCLVGDEILLQWGVLDGGPVLNSITASDAIVIRIGEL